MMKSFDNWLLVNMNMQDGGSNMVFDASVEYNESNSRIQERFERNIVEKSILGLEIYYHFV